MQLYVLLSFLEVLQNSSISKLLLVIVQVCLQAASTVAKIGGVVFLDTGNSFSSKRIAQFLISDPDGKEVENNIFNMTSLVFLLSVHFIFSVGGINQGNGRVNFFVGMLWMQHVCYIPIAIRQTFEPTACSWVE